jgi:hypothetical protein
MSEPLSFTEQTTPSYTRYYLIAGGVVGFLVIAYLVFGGGKPPPPTETKQKRDDPVQTAREALSRATDITTCREALTQINQTLSQHGSGDAARASMPAPAEQVRQRFELKDDEWTEITRESFTLLDGHHLETSFLFRDAVASFTRDGVLDYAPPLRRAELAFDWAVRQVRAPEGRDSDVVPLPLDFVLRRGQGTSLERALVFISLLQQLGLPGCLVAVQEPLPTSFPLWACGVLIERDIYLFDPRMGIPIPGPNSSGVATLAAVQSRPELLKQLETAGYDVSMEKARKARLYLVPPLSALAQRMQYLEKLLQDTEVAAPVVSCKLSVDAPGLFKQWDEALAQGSIKDPAPVLAWPSASRSLRWVLRPAEGGANKTQWSLADEVRKVIPSRYFPTAFNQELGPIKQRMQEKFDLPFVNLFFAPHQPRELLLRGQFDEASRMLTTLRQETIAQAKRLEGNPDMPNRAVRAVNRIMQAQGSLTRAQKLGEPNVDALGIELESAISEGQGWVDAYIEGCAAVPLGQEVNYLLALTKHEQAVRLQLRVEFPNRAGGATGGAADDARKAWLNTADWWTTYLSQYADASTAPAARLQASYARLMLGELDAALDLVHEQSKLTEMEKVGRTIMARRLEKK